MCVKTGLIPEGLGQLESLRVINLTSNKLTGKSLNWLESKEFGFFSILLGNVTCNLIECNLLSVPPSPLSTRMANDFGVCLLRYALQAALSMW